MAVQCSFVPESTCLTVSAPSRASVVDTIDYDILWSGALGISRDSPVVCVESSQLAGFMTSPTIISLGGLREKSTLANVEYSTSDDVLNFQVSRSRLVVLLKNWVDVFDTLTMEHLMRFNRAPDCDSNALSIFHIKTENYVLCAFSHERGGVKLIELNTLWHTIEREADGRLTKLGEFEAHKTPVPCIALSEGAVVTVSERGTLIRVFSLDGTFQTEYRRGLQAATVSSLNVLGPYIVACTDRAAVSVFKFAKQVQSLNSPRVKETAAVKDDAAAKEHAPPKETSAPTSPASFGKSIMSPLTSLAAMVAVPTLNLSVFGDVGSVAQSAETTPQGSASAGIQQTESLASPDTRLSFKPIAFMTRRDDRYMLNVIQLKSSIRALVASVYFYPSMKLHGEFPIYLTE